MQKDINDFVSDLVQHRINECNNEYERRKQARKQFEESYNGVCSYLYKIENEMDGYWIKQYLISMKGCFNRM